MNGHEPFEKRLQRQPLRKVPSAWREEILSAARQADTPRHAPRLTWHGLIATLKSQLSTILWPHPRAWAGMAAAWVLIGLMNLAFRTEVTASARHVAPLSPQMKEMLREQEQLMAELVEDIPAVSRPKAVPPRPQSFYRNEFMNT